MKEYRSCSIPECRTRVYCKNLCKKHYLRKWRHGDSSSTRGRGRSYLHPPKSETKYCHGCEDYRPLDDFFANRSSKDGKQSRCRKHHTEKVRTQYRSKRQFLRSYLASHPCIDCGEADPVVLDFDHVSGKKLAGLSTMISTLRSMSDIVAEIQKCEVRCSNCHRRKTARERHFYADLPPSDGPYPKSRKIDPNLKLKALELRALGLDYKSISTETGLPVTTIGYHCRRSGDPSRR